MGDIQNILYSSDIYEISCLVSQKPCEFDKLSRLCNVLLSLNLQYLSFLSCNNIYLPSSLCSTIAFFLAKPIYPLPGLLIAQLHKTQKKIGGEGKFYPVVFLLNMKSVKGFKCTKSGILYNNKKKNKCVLL